MHSNQLPLLDGIPAAIAPPPAEIVIRKKGRDAAFAKADKVVMAKYVETLKIVGQVKDTFGAWDVTEFFVKQNGKLDEHNRKALGQIYPNLLEQGVIEEAGIGKRPNGNISRVYRLRRG